MIEKTIDRQGVLFLIAGKSIAEYQRALPSIYNEVVKLRTRVAELKGELQHAIEEHNREAQDACNLRARVEVLEEVSSSYHELRNALFEMTHETDSRTIDELVNGDLAIAAAVALMKWHDQSGEGRDDG